MDIRFVKVIIILISFNFSITGYNAKMEKVEFDHFKYGITFEECKKQLENYDIETRGNETIEIANYMSLNEKEVSLYLNFSNELMISSNMENLDDYRLITYAYSIKGVNYKYNKKIVEDFCKLYGEPTTNDFFEKNAIDSDVRSARWELDDYSILITDNTNSQNSSNSFIYVGFRLSGNEREKFKQYVK
jgi:hypothetical protein